ncbi:uncharacterized protein si:rp71-1c10.7 [Heterodontus francisci]|uniref:uncharacterized protein si:rp71-1c10.7 n=1 Tax=Heterodontus francisci TaxID=7792 RepID=UPI00355B9436
MAMKGAFLSALAFSFILCLAGTPTQWNKRKATSECAYNQFWNEDLSKCLSCTICKNQSKTPGCDMCPRECEKEMFWNSDTQRCISCKICRSQPNTPQCDICADTPSTPHPPQKADMPAWIWVLIALAIVAVPLAAGMAWLKSKEFEESEVAKPVQEIGIGDEAEQENLASD